MESSSQSVSINVTFRNLDSTDSLKNYATEKISHCLMKYVHHDIGAEIILLVEKNAPDSFW